SVRQGLTKTDVMLRRVPLPDGPTRLRELGEAITDELFNPLAPLLAAGAGLSAAVGSISDAVMVGGGVGWTGLRGGVQRLSAARKTGVPARAEQRRAPGGRGAHVAVGDAGALVPGDVVLLGRGDVAPADCRILEATLLEIDASSLTGESLPV